MTVHEHLASLYACQEALGWAERHRTAKEVWEKCEWADWLIWWAAMTDTNSLDKIERAVNLCINRISRSEAAKAPDGFPWVGRAIRIAAYMKGATIQRIRANCAAEALFLAAKAVRVAAESGNVTDDVWEKEHKEMCGIIRATLQLPWTEGAS